MPSRRDDFTPATKRALALRASYLCSLCRCSTVGPSDERADAVTNIGEAAHICAAAPGPGARRYNAAMTPKQRSHIDNGIWLCATCARKIDRDEAFYTAIYLRGKKAEHEHSRRVGRDGEVGQADIIALGPSIIAIGEVVGSGPRGLRARIEHFVEGSSRELLSFAQDFERLRPADRYALLNQLGLGTVLMEPPTVERSGGTYEVAFSNAEYLPRLDATKNIKSLSAETLQFISGLDAFVQNFEQTLGMGRGTWFADLDAGSNLSDLFWRYNGSPWFSRLAMNEMIRLSCLPSSLNRGHYPATPFACVNRVNRVEVSDFTLQAHKLAINVEFDLEGIGRWEGMLSVFISTPEQLEEHRESARIRAAQIRQVEARYSAKNVGSDV